MGTEVTPSQPDPKCSRVVKLRKNRGAHWWEITLQLSACTTSLASCDFFLVWCGIQVYMLLFWHTGGFFSWTSTALCRKTRGAQLIWTANTRSLRSCIFCYFWTALTNLNQVQAHRLAHFRTVFSSAAIFRASTGSAVLALVPPHCACCAKTEIL